MKTRGGSILVIVALAMFAAGCGKEKTQVAAEKPPEAKGVRVEPAAMATIDDFYEATGTIRSGTATIVSARAMGAITALRVREGDRVRVGQALIEIDNREAAAQLQKAQAGLREAQEAQTEVERSIGAAQAALAAADANKRLAAATLARYQSLLDRKSVSPQEFDEVRARHQIAEAESDRAEKTLQVLAAKKSQTAARIEQAKADIAAVQVQVGYARIVAPINGIVTAKHVDLGAMASPGAPLLTIEDDANYRLEAAVEESQTRAIRLQAPARVTIDALGGETIDGRVVEIVPTADPGSRSYTVKIQLPARLGVRTGMFGKARFAHGQRSALLVPASALVERGQLVGIYVVDGGGIARLRLVTLGKRDGDRQEILSGLNNGERIVTDAKAIPREGVAVSSSQ